MAIIISISGDSGVGKSSVADLFKMILGESDVLLLKCDDLHKWERQSKKWKSITHLNPGANDLKKGYLDLVDLSKGKSVFRRLYCHETGKFSDPTGIVPKKYIIHEGLHSFYTEEMAEISHLKIFIEATDALRMHWKVLRDVYDRSHSKQSVLRSIQRRKSDYDKFVIKQRNNADIVLRFSEKSNILSVGDLDENPPIDLLLEIKNYEIYSQYKKIIDQLTDYNDRFNNLVRACREIGEDVTLTQASGGNVSVKFSENISAIKASGHELGKISRGRGIAFYDPFDIKQFLNESSVDKPRLLRDCDEILFQKLSSNSGRASMESGFHACLSTYVIHTHPIYINVLLCLKNANDIIRDVFGEECGYFLDFSRPGFEISREVMLVNEAKGVFWLKNHGIITSYETVDECLKTTKELNEKAFSYIKSKIKGVIPFTMWESDSDRTSENFMTPDAVVFSEKPNLTTAQRTTLLADSYIRYYGSVLGDLDFLCEDEVNYIKNMKFEKCRRAS
jgi:uridine kinase/ribulose-5-phosphate 4-epimerase/fuculose-1-phosphate aldolase